MNPAREASVRLARLLEGEHAAMADFLVALAKFDRDRLWVELGHASLFDFLHRELRLSKASAFYRKSAALLVQRYPEVVAPLKDGRLCLTAVIELAKVITPENRQEVLPRFFHCSKREAKEVAAELLPQAAPPRRDVVTTVTPATSRRFHASRSWHDRVRLDEPTHRQIAAGGGENPSGSDEPNGTERVPGVERPSAVPLNAQQPEPVVNAPVRALEKDRIDPLTAVLRRLHITVTARFVRKLEAARAALSHTHPTAKAEEVLETGLDLILARDAKKKGHVVKPQRKARPSSPGRVAARVKRVVWQRDGGRCQWPLESGGVCGSTLRVQVDHIVPRALGGPGTVENTQLLCAHHNQLAARQIFGDVHMDRFARRPGAPPDAPGAAVVRPGAQHSSQQTAAGASRTGGP